VKIRKPVDLCDWLLWTGLRCPHFHN